MPVAAKTDPDGTSYLTPDPTARTLKPRDPREPAKRGTDLLVGTLCSPT